MEERIKELENQIEIFQNWLNREGLKPRYMTYLLEREEEENGTKTCINGESIRP